jgi:hypothetical protein
MYGALAVTVVFSAASGKVRQAADEPVLPPQPANPRLSRQPVPLPGIELERLQLQEAEAETRTPADHAFRAMSWYVPPPPPPPRPPPKPLPPPPPTAPPMPFSFMGRYEEEGTRIILLVKGERIYTVSEGEVIDNTYRVERLTGGQLELTYLPLNIKQTISAGGT